MKHKRIYGDTKLFRAALMLSGFFEQASNSSIFNDRSVDGRRRRLKLWFASDVKDASHEQQEALENNLRGVFGDRLQAVYMIPGQYRWDPIWSLCVRLAVR